MLADNIQMLGDAVGDAFQRGFVHVRAGMLQGEPKEDAPRVRVIDGSAFAGKIRQGNQPVAASGDVFQLIQDAFIRVASAFFLLGQLVKENIVAEPTRERAGVVCSASDAVRAG